jgi:hypothetical protein
MGDFTKCNKVFIYKGDFQQGIVLIQANYNENLSFGGSKMRKLISLLSGCLVIFSLLFVTPGNAAFAAEEECECHNVTFIFGAEKNKVVSNILKSDEFKNAKKDWKNNGYSFNGVDDVEVIKFNSDGSIMVGFPVTNKDGVLGMAAFQDGKYLGVVPNEEDHEH